MNQVVVPDKKCLQCKISFNRRRAKSGRLESLNWYRVRKFCSQKCTKAHQIGNQAANYKHGKYLIQVYCKDCNKKLHPDSNYQGSTQCMSCERKSRFLDPRKHPRWKGGKSFENYPRIFDKELKQLIRSRDNYKCQNCGFIEQQYIKKYNRVLDIHHIDYNKENCQENNLITLCLGCNVKANTNRKNWKKYYQEMVN